MKNREKRKEKERVAARSEMREKVWWREKVEVWWSSLAVVTVADKTLVWRWKIREREGVRFGFSSVACIRGYCNHFYVMIGLKDSVPIAFGGTEEPAAYGELVSIGGLTPDVNKNLSAEISTILETKLSVPKSRFFLKFYDTKASYINLLRHQLRMEWIHLVNSMLLLQNLQQPAAKLGLAWTLVSNWLPNRVLRYSPLLRWWQRLVLARVLASWDIVDIVDDIKSMSSHPSPSMLIPALCIVGNIVTEDDMQTQGKQIGESRIGESKAKALLMKNVSFKLNAFLVLRLSLF
ncbi:hypothetical protein TEA_026149 [Camellia sinensis var. sinensis]|uniref:Uncharacterized protein n=1 Tax=Camellia sinensis var. sinensis TaxID=542762 RepID=A0A4V3WL24_CAMSN|nr:hypothetical protein TEA_026149 [Camellia sinensis var. sinensis]